MRLNSLTEQKYYSTIAFNLSFVIGFTFCFLSLNQTPYANGWDGYYYVMQAHSWLTYGNLQSPDSSIIYPYFIAICYFVDDYIFAFKIGSSILGGILAASAFLLAHEITKKQLIAIIAPAFLIFSPTTTYLISQFPKNVLGLIFFILFLRALFVKRYWLTLAFLILALLSHRMTGGLCLIAGLIYALRVINIKFVIAIVSFALLLSVLPGILHISDLARFEGQLSYIPQFAPWSFFGIFKTNISYWWTLELVLISCLLIYTIYQYVSNLTHNSPNWFDKLVWPIIILVSIFPFFTLESGSMGYRFFMISPILLVTYSVSKIKLPNSWVICITITLICCSAFTYKSYNPVFHDPPNSQYELIINRLEQAYDSKQYPLVIVHKSLAEMIIYNTGFDALNWQPPEKSDRKQVLRIVSNLDYIHFASYLNETELLTIKKLTLHYYAMPETTWNHFYKEVLSKKDERIITRLKKGGNPIENRPYYLLKGKEKL